MPVGTDDLLAAIVGLEGAMVDHACEAVFLSLRALAVELGPLAHLDHGLERWRAPVHEELALFGYNNHKEARVVVCGGFPRSTIDLTAIVQSTRGCDLKTLEAMMLVVIEHAQQAPILLGKAHRHGQGIDRTVDDKHRAAGGLDHLLTVGFPIVIAKFGGLRNDPAILSTESFSADTLPGLSRGYRASCLCHIAVAR